MSRLARAVVAALVAWVALTGPAAAIETAEFGIEPWPTARDGERRQSLHEDVPPGGETTDAVRLWNRTDRPVTLRLSAVAARRAADGTPELGGDPTAAGWVDFEGDEVVLAPGGEQVVRFTVRAPRDLADREQTFAVLAEPVLAAGEAPAVVQRLALMAYVRPRSGSPSAAEVALGALPWVAAGLAVLMLVALVAVRPRLGRERSGGGGSRVRQAAALP